MTDYLNIKNIISSEISAALESIQPKNVIRFMGAVLKAKRVFCTGAGRSGLMVQAFAKRLNHLGMEAYVVGETTLPAIGKGDLLIVSSGSGKTASPVGIAKIARKHGAKVIFITASSGSAVEKLAGMTIKINVEKEKSEQPMMSLYEQCSLIFFDTVCTLIVRKKRISEKDMLRRHTNLE